ncbi:pyridoxine/pyridoxamine 5'-phosphate oxidase [Bemisia tabaci]
MSKHPMELFKAWYGDHVQLNPNNLMANVLSLSTATKSGRVSNRTLILRRLDEDGFVIMTDGRSKKSAELAENPFAAMSFLWLCMKGQACLSRQVRIEGKVEALDESNWIDIYEKEPLFCKIRAHICNQGREVEWRDLKNHHDQLLKEVEEGNRELEKPAHVVAYKLHPDMIEFYESFGLTIGDRLLYRKQDDNSWRVSRIAA